MNLVLEGLKERREAARLRHAEISSRHQAITALLNSATAEFNVWNAAYSCELKEQEKRDQLEAEEKAKQPTLPGTTITSEPEPDAPTPVVCESAPEAHQESVNQTAIVRDALRLRPSGMTPADLWKAHKEEISSRPYLYSILKRMRDKDEVALRRGKYVLKPKPSEVRPEAVTEVQTIQ
jgi:hypothetical protein